MYQFFVEEQQITEGQVLITGQDFHHLKNAVRLKPGERIRVSVKGGDSYFCVLKEIQQEYAVATITQADDKGTELGGKIYLFQGLPKGDKMELIIQKAVELGVYAVIPVAMKNCVTKLDEKKAASKVSRWQAIAEAAAKQSKRSRIPEILPVMSYQEAVEYANEHCEKRFVPYENEQGMAGSHRLMDEVKSMDTVSVFVGPEGGFTPEEIDLARRSMESVSLGKRILRTETAAITMLSILMFQMERE